MADSFQDLRPDKVEIERSVIKNVLLSKGYAVSFEGDDLEGVPQATKKIHLDQESHLYYDPDRIDVVEVDTRGNNNLGRPYPGSFINISGRKVEGDRTHDVTYYLVNKTPAPDSK